MKSVLAVVAVISLVMNSFLVYDTYFQGGKSSSWLINNNDGEGAQLSDLTVNVPPVKLGDMMTYDYKIFAQMYWKDYESGNWSDMRLTINGQLRHWYHPDTVEKRDGFWLPHNVLHFEQDTSASFEVYIAGSDSETLSIPGSLDGERHEYKDLTEELAITTETKGTVTIDRLPRINQALTYKGDVETFMNPDRPVEKTMDEQIYGNGQQLKLKDNGTVVQSRFYSLYNVTLASYYNWTIDRAVMFKGYKTLHLNITSVLYGELADFNEQIWISSDSPFPIKRYTKTNQTWADENGTFWFVIETTNTMVDKGYSAGDIDVPWGSCKGNHWPDRNPDGEYEPFTYMPETGKGMSASSFDFRSEDADKLARQSSPGLKNFLAKYDQPGNAPTVIYGIYNASKNPIDVNGKAGSYRWNLTYGHFPTDEEWEEARETHNYNFTYSIVLIKNVTKDLTKPLQSQYTETVEVENDWGLVRDYAALPREALPSEALTVASSEDIMMKHPTIKAQIADKNGEIDWGDFELPYGIILAGASTETTPGYQMVELLTGITMPSADYAWTVQKGTIYETGSTFTATVDADNGQLVYIMDIEGTALMGLFQD